MRDGDPVRIEIDTVGLTGTVDVDADLSGRDPHPGLGAQRARLPDDTRLWAALQARSGGSWGGCVYDTDEIIAALDAESRR